MYIYVYIYIYLCISMYIYVYLCIYLCISVYICLAYYLVRISKAAHTREDAKNIVVNSIYI